MTTTVPTPSTPPAVGSRIRGLQCRECGQSYAAEARHVCEMCCGPLEVAYDYDVIRASDSRVTIEHGPRTIWRYRRLQSIEGDRVVDSHSSFTPLVRAYNLGRSL